jgi:hypothetical protein
MAIGKIFSVVLMALAAVLFALFVFGAVCFVLELLSFLWRWLRWQLWYKESGAGRPTFDWYKWIEVAGEIAGGVLEGIIIITNSSDD